MKRVMVVTLTFSGKRLW